MNADGSWRSDTAGAPQVHKVEIQTRFHDSLSAPYWSAYWGTLPGIQDIASTTVLSANCFSSKCICLQKGPRGYVVMPEAISSYPHNHDDETIQHAPEKEIQV